MTTMLNRSSKVITESWITFLKVLSGKTKIKFVIAPNAPAATDGKTIWSPSLPAVLTEDDLVIFKSNTLHEVGHNMHSNIPFFQAFSKKHGSFAGFLLNALDDVYMEKRQCRSTRQGEPLFRKSATIMFQRKQFRDGSASPAEAVGSYALCFLFTHFCKWNEYRDPLAAITENFNLHFGEYAVIVKSKLDEILLAEFPSVQSTDHAGDLVLRIIEMLKQEADQQDEEGEGEDDTKTDEEESEEKSNDESKSEGGSNGEPKGNDPAKAGTVPEGSGNGSGNETAQGGDGPDGENEAGSSTQGKGPSLKEIVNGMVEAGDLGEREVFDKQAEIIRISESVAAGNNPDYKGASMVPSMTIDGTDTGTSTVPGGKGAGEERELIDGMPLCPIDIAHSREMSKSLDRKVQVLASRLQSLLVNQEEVDAFSADRGSLGDAHLYRLKLGSTRIFVQHEEAERPTAAVSLVADLSGSTLEDLEDLKYSHPEAFDEDGNCELDFPKAKGDSIARSIQKSLLILEKVLDQVGTPREILGFAPRNGELMTVVRTFGDAHQSAMNRIAGLRQITGGSHTPIGEAVFHAGARLMSHDAQKKFLWVLTDGAPSNVNKALEMTRFCEGMGIRVMYLLIGDDVREDWIKEAGIPFARAKTADEIGPVLLDNAKKLLM